MDWMHATGWFVLIWIVVSLGGFVPLVLLIFADFSVMSDPGRERDILVRAAKAIGERWLTTNGFEPEGVLAPLGVTLAMFRHTPTHTALVVYLGQTTCHTDFVTIFANHVGVTTASTVNGVAAPPAPGTVMQCLPSSSLAERWRAHQDGVALIGAGTSAAPVAMGSIETEMAAAVRRQCRHIFAHPWLVLALPYRFFVTRWRYRNVTVAQQIERGWVSLARLARQVQLADG